MKVKYLMLSLFGALALTVSAQESVTPGQKASAITYENAGIANHWFITLQGGVGSQHVGFNGSTKYLDRLSQAYSLSLGKFINPSFATRLQVFGAQAPTGNEKNASTLYKTSFVSGHFDFMYNVLDLFMDINPERIVKIMPFTGFGYTYKFVEDFKEPFHAASINAGVSVPFRVSKRIDIVLEGQATYNNLNLRKPSSTVRWNDGAYNGLFASLTAGINVHLGDVEWKAIVPMDEAYMASLNNEVSSLRAEGRELSKRPVSCPECPDAVSANNRTISTNGLEKVVLFRFDKDIVDDNQKVILTSVADYVKQFNTPIQLTGYADIDGTDEYNMDLSERRVKAVAKVLVEEMGVSQDMIFTDFKGETSELFETKAWNRAVVIRVK